MKRPDVARGEVSQLHVFLPTLAAQIRNDRKPVVIVVQGLDEPFWQFALRVRAARSKGVQVYSVEVRPEGMP